MMARLFVLSATLLSLVASYRPTYGASRPPVLNAACHRTPTIVMGRKFENNKLKMAKTALANAKKASYIGKKVVIAVKAGGDDPAINRQLAAVMREANALDVTKDVVDRNIKRAMDSDTSDYKELVYEAYGHGGVGMIINCLSDNNNRAVEQVTTAIKKENCKVAASGSVAFNFQRKGRLSVRVELDEEDVLELAIEAGCDGDVAVEPPDPDGRGDDENVKCIILTEPTELGLMQSALQDANHECSGLLVNVPMTFADCSDEDEELNYKLIDRLDELDDVSFVEHNMAPAA